MPRVLRKSKRRNAGYTDRHIYQLNTGLELFDDAFGWDQDFDEAAAREAWELMREKLMADWIREQPGTRPWAWWAFDAPQPARRERIDGGVHPHDNKARSLKVANSDSEYLWKVAYRLTFGLPSCYIPPFDNGIKTEWFEPEWAFLHRHNLLRPDDSPEFLAPTENNKCHE
jgi:hypothetical protein